MLRRHWPRSGARQTGKEKIMTRCFVSAVMLALIGARVAAAEEDLAGQLKTLQKERVKVLAELVEIRAMQYKVATHPCEFVAGAEADLAKAQLDATDNREGRIAVLEESAKRFAELLKIAEARLEVGTAPEADVYRLRSLLLGAKVRLFASAARTTERRTRSRHCKRNGARHSPNSWNSLRRHTGCERLLANSSWRRGRFGQRPVGCNGQARRANRRAGGGCQERG